jgi:hypothetical protein
LATGSLDCFMDRFLATGSLDLFMDRFLVGPIAGDEQELSDSEWMLAASSPLSLPMPE